MSVDCPYCNIMAERCNGDRIYPHRPDLYNKHFYVCPQCGAYVGCHPGTWKHMGRLANAELRAAKSAAHLAFDKLWKGGKMSRRNAYAWLAKALDINPLHCHIGMFDVDQCKKVVEVVKAKA